MFIIVRFWHLKKPVRFLSLLDNMDFIALQPFLSIKISLGNSNDLTLVWFLWGVFKRVGGFQKSYVIFMGGISKYLVKMTKNCKCDLWKLPNDVKPDTILPTWLFCTRHFCWVLRFHLGTILPKTNYLQLLWLQEMWS